MRPLIAIVGPTASGKSALAIQIAERFNGEVVAADSQTIYRGMDIGTAKPAPADREHIPHHLLDVVNPDENFTAADFKELANQAIGDIIRRGKLPILVGGTGLYIDAVLYDYQFRPSNEALRDQLSTLTLEELQEKAAGTGLDFNDSDWKNPRRLIRAIESEGQASSKRGLRENTLVIGLDPGREVTDRRIETRAHEMIEAGLLDEVKGIVENHGADNLKGIAYPIFAPVLEGSKTIEKAAHEFAQGDRRLARRQRTWFKRNSDIKWSENGVKAMKKVEEFLGQG